MTPSVFTVPPRRAVMLSWTEDRLRFDLTPADEAKLAEFRAGLGGSPDGGREKS